LNGVLTATEDLKGENWKNLVANSDSSPSLSSANIPKDVFLYRTGQKESPLEISK
jgi:hypothetical protein